jgi:putative phage-type endonuclease
MDDDSGPFPRIEPAPPLDHTKRNQGVTSTEIAAVMGIAEYEDALTVYARKVGELERPKESPIDLGPMRWGRSQEPELLIAYMEITGAKLIRPGTMEHPDRPWQVASPDGLVLNSERKPTRGVEAKTAGWRMASKWGDPEIPGEQDRIPLEYFCQSQYASSVCGGIPWDVPALIGGQDFRLYHLEFDRELEEMMLEAAYKFVTQYLLPRIPPPPSGLNSSTEYIKRKFSKHSAPMMVAAPQHEAAARRLAALIKIEELVSHELERAKNRLKFEIGPAEGIEGHNWKIRWKKNKDSEKVDWQAVATEYSCALGLIASAAVTVEDAKAAAQITLQGDMVKKYTSVRPGARPFCPELEDVRFEQSAPSLMKAAKLTDDFIFWITKQIGDGK